MMNGRTWVIAWKELIQMRRDRMTVGMMVGLPLLQLMLFGYAINTDVRHMPLVVYDSDHSASSRKIVQGLTNTGYYDLVGAVQNYGEIDRALRSGRARVALVVPAGFHRRVGGQTQTAPLQLIVDGSDPQTVASAINTASGYVASQSAELTIAKQGLSGRTIPLGMSLEPATWYNPELRTAIFVVPGLVGVILTMTMVMLTAMAIARERERGTLEQLIVSPVRKLELTVGKILPYIVVGYVQMSLILTAGYFIFDVPLVGNLGLLFALAFVFIAANLALGLFFSTLARTQQQAMQMSFFFLLPNILLSGFMFPFEAMPRPAQYIAQGLPLTHFLRIVRGIALKGAGFGDVQFELLWMMAILAVLVSLASLRFTKKLG